jgi:hypothetical protein
MALNELRIIEFLGAEIGRATAAGDQNRARKLADLQGRVIAQVSREIAAYGAAVPRSRSAPPEECIG